MARSARDTMLPADAEAAVPRAAQQQKGAFSTTAPIRAGSGAQRFAQACARGGGALLVWVPQTRTRSSAARTKQTKPLRVGANHAFYLLVCEAALRHSKQKTLDQRRHLQCASMIHSHLARGVLELCLHDVRAARDCAEHGLNQSACMRRNDTVTSPVASGGASGGNLLSGHREPPTGTTPPYCQPLPAPRCLAAVLSLGGMVSSS